MRAARMFELDSSKYEGLEKMGIKMPIFKTKGEPSSVERVPQTPRKNGSGRRLEPHSGVEAIPEARLENASWQDPSEPIS
jgi:hypothetical protein